MGRLLSIGRANSPPASCVPSAPRWVPLPAVGPPWVVVRSLGLPLRTRVFLLLPLGSCELAWVSAGSQMEAKGAQGNPSSSREPTGFLVELKGTHGGPRQPRTTRGNPRQPAGTQWGPTGTQ